MDKADIRTINTSIRAVQNDHGNHVISGKAIAFNTRSEYMGFYEVVKPEAVRNVDWQNVMLLYNHDYSNILARTDAKNLEIEVRDDGVYFTAQVPNTTLANDVYEDVLAGNIRGCSFGFTVKDGGDEWSKMDDGTPLRTITKIDSIPELSLTAIPAYIKTSATVVRNLEKMKKGDSDMEKEKDPKAIIVNDEDLDKAKEGVEPPVDSDKTDSAEEKKEVEPPVEDKVDDDSEKASEKLKSKVQIGLDAELKDAVDTMKSLIQEIKDKKDGENVIDKEERNANPKAEVPENNENGGEDMAQVIKQKEEKTEEVRNFEHWLKGETRDLTTGFKESTDGSAVIPQQILDLYKEPNDPTQLVTYINRVNVSAPTGRLPILAKSTIGLTPTDELAENPNIANATISKVDYALETMRGMLPVSMEMIQDYPDITSILSEYVAQAKRNTEQKAIGTVLQTATAKTAKSIDDVKGLYNTLINYGSDRKFVVTNSMYTEIDTLKNGIGDYMLNQDLSSATGKSLLGAEMIIVPDEILGSTGEKKMFIGSLKAFVMEAVKGEISLNWKENRYFEQVLGVAIRMDVVKADAGAGYFVTYTPAEVASASTASK